MKNMTLAVMVIVLAAIIIFGFRYSIVVNSPIVAKIDRITGDVWVANSGEWLMVKHPADEKCLDNCSLDVKRAEKAAEVAVEEKAPAESAKQ